MQLKLILAIIFISISISVKSQYYTSGEDPHSLKWNQIETPNFKLVFPEAYSEKAQYIVKLLEEVYQQGGRSLNHSPKKIRVLIHPETSYSNGFVTWAPKRIELFPTPNQSIYSQEWLQQLTVHEFRHVVQIDKLNKGFTKLLSYVLGEQAVGGILGLYLPMWFLEGDAVVAETSLTQTGRGRSPWFEQRLRAQVMEQKTYSYDKAYFGSYRDFTPNYYELGYQLVAKGREMYGLELWNQRFYDLVSNTLILHPFLSKEKRKSYVNKTKLYHDVLSELHKDWLKQDSSIHKTPYVEITQRDRDYVNFKYPVLRSDGKIIAELSGPGEITQFVLIDSVGNYKRLYTPGNINDEPFSYNNNTLCWAEYISDKRWENRGWSVIKCLDLNTSEVSVVKNKTRYFSPYISEDGSKIVAVKASKDNKYALVVIDRISGEELDEFNYDATSYYFTPSWSPNEDKIVCICLTDKGKKIIVYNFTKGHWSDVTESTYDDISLPKWKDDHTILFSAGYSGIEDIYSVNVESKQVQQITQSQYGATGAIFDPISYSYIYSRYSSNGFQIVKSSLSDEAVIPLKQVKNHSNQLYQIIADQEPGKLDFSKVDTLAKYPVTRYSKLKNLFNVHSWAPVNLNVDDQMLGPGVSAFSQNLLGTAITLIGYNADSQNSLEKFHFNFQYRGFYPVIELDLKQGNERVSDGIYSFDSDTAYVSQNPKQNQTEVEVGINIPLNFTRNKFYRYLQPSVNYNLIHRSGYKALGIPLTRSGNEVVQNGEPRYYYRDDFNYSTLEYSLYLHNLLKSSSRDVTYRWGQVFEINYQSTPLGGIDVGEILGARARFYFPGLLKHHSVRIDNEFQYKWKGEEYQNNNDDTYRHFYRFGNYFNYARGYINYTNDELYSLKTNYIFPLWNPDLSLPGVLYLKRITSTFFFDYSRSTLNYYYKDSNQKTKVINDFKSVGAEFLCEVHAFRFLFPINVGYRYSRLLDFNSNYHEMLLGINISGFSIGK
ncbi:TolB family protein [Plebeiibacterium sediminum]|uniref:Uncharacterized protein n=1 Tax=Plebeiibacterium sediminum TaxID=2992112 RepID=A0AAE3M900_9BACT|nr:hypothetical protein [Plebeiobacterium sediminum]MCW3789035.1 hypothetical protein [Plebeiobacterium sediminum]